MIRFAAAQTLGDLAARHGGKTKSVARVENVRRLEDANAGDLAPFSSKRFVDNAKRASDRGAVILASPDLAKFVSGEIWTHENVMWALAEILDACVADSPRAIWGEGTTLGENVVLSSRVVIGARVRIDANSVIGRAGFGWAMRDGETRAVPQLGGVVIEDDVHIGPLCTIDCGTLAPTRIRRGAKLDAQVHVGHNGDIGEGSIIAAQTGLAGSVVIGRGVLIGGQVGIADHVRVGDGAKIAAKSGVIGDVPRGAVVAGYPAQPRMRWLRALARAYRDS